jgi:uncharacterized protein
MRKLRLIFTVAIFTMPVVAQPSTAKAPAQVKPNQTAALPADAPTREDVLKLFQMLDISKTMDAMFKAAKEQTREMAEQMIQEKIPEATAAQKKQFEEMLDEVFAEALGPKVMNEILEATVPVYQRHLSKSDLEAMMAFYSSPVGQKLLREQPAMVQESMQAAAGIQQRLARSVFMKIDERMQKLTEQDKENAKPK